MKSITIQDVTREGFNDIGPVAKKLAYMEGLTAHALAVEVRERYIERQKGPFPIQRPGGIML
jgi:histidinol dehydrogenase